MTKLYNFTIFIFFLCYLFRVGHCEDCPHVLPIEPNQDQLQNKSTLTTSRVSNGTPSSANTALYHARVLEDSSNRGRRVCSAVRIARYWLLTAAHCQMDTKNWHVILSDKYAYKIEEVHRHPSYSSPGSIPVSDLAVVRISTNNMLGNPPELNNYPPLNNNVSLPLPYSFVRSSGFGRTESRKLSSAILEEADLPVLPLKYCRHPIDEKKQMCMGYLDRTCDVCRGDSGGPVMQPGKGGQPVVVGLVSAGYGTCGARSHPSVSALVAHSLPWLKEIGVTFNTGIPLQYVWKDHPYERTTNSNFQNIPIRPKPTPPTVPKRSSSARSPIKYPTKSDSENDDDDD